MSGQEAAREDSSCFSDHSERQPQGGWCCPGHARVLPFFPTKWGSHHLKCTTSEKPPKRSSAELIEKDFPGLIHTFEMCGSQSQP